MVRDTLENIKNQKEIRQNLIQLKSELKEGFNKEALLYQLGGDYRLFEELLNNEDAKVRKNTALIIGILGIQQYLDKLYQVYQKEEQLFVKSSYLTAMAKLDYKPLLPELKERLIILENQEIKEDDNKHISEEIRTLTGMILAEEGIKQHKFTGFNVPSEIVLLTNRNFKNVTSEQLKSLRVKEFNAGVLVKTNDLRELLPVRTYDELLFMLDDVKVCSKEPDLAATAIAASSLLEFMKSRHKGDAPYYFRIELKSKMELDKKSSFTKKLGSRIEQLTNRKLINSTSNYEFELRLIENKEGKYNLLIKLFTLKDERFTYRKQSIATSIQPVNAALMAALSKDYLQEGAQVLDPFCGVGTMLIERNQLVKADTMYGLDIYADAVNKAKENTEAAHTVIHYINRDFFDFKHSYLFDEIFTDMPRAIGHKEEDEIFTIYRKFFLKAPEHMKKNGILILYSHNKEYVKKLIKPDVYRLEQEYEISRKEGAYLFIIRFL